MNAPLLNERDTFLYSILFTPPAAHFTHPWTGCIKLFKCNINKKFNNVMFTKCGTSSNRNRTAVHQFFFTAKSGAGLTQKPQAQF